MGNYLVTDTELTGLADAIRDKTGGSDPLEWPTGFTSAVSGISDSRYKQLVERSVTSLGENDFAGITKIGNYAFAGTSLKTVAIPSGVDFVGAYAFQDCFSLESVTLPSDATVIPSYAFAHCISLREIALPEGITMIGSNAFAQSAITDFYPPQGVKAVGSYAFFNCTALQNAVFLNGLERIGYGCFLNCSNLLAVNFPATMKIIERNALAGLKLTVLQCRAVEPPVFDYDNDQIGLNTNAFLGPIIVPLASVDAYKAAPVWKKYKDYITGNQFLE